MSEGISGFSDAVQFWKKAVKEEQNVTSSEQSGKKVVRPGIEKGYDALLLSNTVSEGNKLMRRTSLQFSLHEDLHRPIVKIVDRDTKELIREIPPEKFLDMAAAFMKQAGLIVDESV